jgi:hypothetical protein
MASTTAAGRLTGAAVLTIAMATALKAALMIYATRDQYAVTFDSNFYLNIASNYFAHGGLTPEMWRIPKDNIIISGSGSGYGIFLLIGWLKLFGLTLAAGQTLMFLCGLLTLPIAYVLVREFWNSHEAGLLGVAWLSLSSLFVPQFWVRMDAPAVLCVFTVLALHQRASRSERYWLHLPLGIAAIALVEVHVLTLIWAVTLGLVHLADAVTRLRKGEGWRALPLAWFVAGAAPSAAVYALIHILPDPSSYFLIAHEASVGGHVGPIQEAARLMRFVTEVPMDALAIALGFAFCLARGGEADRRLVLFAVSFAVSMAIINPPVSVAYSAHALPLFALAIGGLWSEPVDRLRSSLAAAASLVFLVQLGATVRTASKTDGRPSAAVEYVRRYVPREVVVWGSPTLFHQLLDYSNFLSFTPMWDSQLGAKLRHESYATFLEQERPQLLIGHPLPEQRAERDYLSRHHFSEVRPDIWADPSLLAAIARRSEPARAEFASTTVALVPGECATLSWVTTGGDATIDGAPSPAAGEAKVCPTTTTRYALSLSHATGVLVRDVTISVAETVP